MSLVYSILCKGCERHIAPRCNISVEMLDWMIILDHLILFFAHFFLRFDSGGNIEQGRPYMQQKALRDPNTCKMRKKP